MNPMTHNTMDEEQTGSGWMVGGMAFAGTMLILSGAFQAAAGLAAILDDEYVVVSRRYAFDLDVTAWGWIHLVLGLAVLMAGFGVFAERTWAVVTALVLAVVSAINNFFFIPHAPLWSILVIAINVWIIWSLAQLRIRTVRT
jgi:hypothetical protein